MRISVTYFTKSVLYTFSMRKLQFFVDSYKELLYYHAHNLIMGDEEKSKCTSLAKRAFVMVQEGAGGDIEDDNTVILCNCQQKIAVFS